MIRLAMLTLKVLWLIAGLAFGFCGIWLRVFYLWKNLWKTVCESELRERRYIGWVGGLLLSAAAVILIGLFC